ncbi:MAG: hypothetical protein R2912_10405 [Eubacteriales bacterium]
MCSHSTPSVCGTCSRKFSISLNTVTVFDAMIADYLLDATRPATSFAMLCERVCPNQKQNVAMLFSLQRSMHRELEEANMSKLYSEMELPLAGVLLRWNIRGSVWMRHSQAVADAVPPTSRANRSPSFIYELTGETFNILSPLNSAKCC